MFCGVRAASQLAAAREPPKSEGGVAVSFPDGISRIDYVLALLDSRDHQLDNLEYKIHEVCENVRLSDGHRQAMGPADYTFRRRGTKLWMHLTAYKNKEIGTVREDGFVNWDGSFAKGVALPPYFGVAYDRGSIRRTENDNFTYRKYNELLGIRVQVDDYGLPITDFLRDAIAQHWQIDVSTDSLKSNPDIRVKVHRIYDEWTFWIDPRRGNMIERFEHKYELHGGYNRSFEEALASEQVAGVWLPRKAIRRTGTSASPGEESEMTYNVTTISVGTVRDEDVNIDFRPGTEVVDAVNNISYTVLPDGKFRLLPLADPPSRTLRMPPKVQVTDRVGSEAARKYSSQPLAVAPRETLGGAAKWSRARIAGIGFSIAIVVALASIIYRRRVRGVRLNAS